MLEGGADIRFIQQLLGHAELTTTQLYTHVTIGALKAVHERTHPGAGNRPPRPPWPPQHRSRESLEDLNDDDDNDGIGSWDRRAAALLAELDEDEPET